MVALQPWWRVDENDGLRFAIHADYPSANILSVNSSTRLMRSNPSGLSIKTLWGMESKPERANIEFAFS